MCFQALIGPAISAATGIGGALLSGSGAAANAQAQSQHDEETAINNTAAAAASNKVLSSFLDKQQVNQNTNQATLQPEYASIAPAAFQASQGQLAGANDTAAQQAISAVLAGGGKQIGLTSTDNGQSAAAINNAAATRTQLSRNDASNYANLAAYGGNFAKLGLNEMNTNEGIDQTNSQARGQAGILPTDEANAALQARQFIPATDDTSGNTAIGIGNLLASNAGGIGTAASKAASGLGGLFAGLNAPSTSNPTLNTGETSGYGSST